MKDLSFINSIKIQPIVGPTVPAKLAVLDVALYDTSDEEASNGGMGAASRQPCIALF